MSKMRLDPNEMSFLDHLEDLRWHILRSFIAIFIVGIGAFIFKDFIFDKIIFGPKDINFPTYKILCTISNFIGLDDSFCIICVKIILLIVCTLCQQMIYTPSS